ncbi:MAG TPA: threonine--tRNA ligase [Candidatus Deferrimicrobiaceae bacterium]|nr:threonine--tRNA ligase [Candidatus Deferrimicrobiaceae bacterium]
MAEDEVTGPGEEPEDEGLLAPERGSVDELLDAGAHDELDAMRHSAAHVMAEAVLDLFPGAKLGIGPAIADAFYYDFDLPRALTPDDLEAIEGRMRASVAADHPFVRREVPFDDARAVVEGQGQSYKAEILDNLETAAEAAGEPRPAVSFYEHGQFSDLCRGPHVASTGRIGPFKLLSVAGAYWRGDEKRPMLQRIYGTVWQSQDDLDQFLWRRAEAKKRDHRRLGVQLDLFSFHDVSPGSAFWHPKGQVIWRALEDAMRELQGRRGYQEVSTPIVVSERLWRQSGHWELYRDNMFLVESENQTFSLKPMNCPESTFIYRSHLRSYRDLPLRYSEFGRLHRNERSGTLSGLTRVRQFIQDDAHLYVRADQLTDEIQALLGEVREAYGWFGLEPRFTFATKPDKAIGDPALWERAERLTVEAFAAADISYELKPKDGTFYAPKIDIYIDDALGREWQMATIQIDLTMLPERFDLTYIDESGSAVRPIAIHRAIYGSLERFIGILIEHFAGAFPFWIAPVQAVVIPIADRHLPAVQELGTLLRGRGLRVDVDASDARMQNKIRLAQEQKVPYMLVLGDREVEAGTATVRRRGEEKGAAQETLGWAELADRFVAEAAARGARGPVL